MDLYRTFPNLLYLTAGLSLPWTPETVTWTLITVSIDCWFVLGVQSWKAVKFQVILFVALHRP